MKTKNLEKLDIKTARKMLDNRELKVQELVDYYLNNIEKKNKELNIYLSIFQNITEQVAEAQKKIDAGKSEILTGIPFAIKNFIAIQGENTTASSKILENYLAPYDATVIKKLKVQNPIFLGYANADEFACGSSGENSAYGFTRNPVSPERVPGGTSSGPASAIAADMALVSLGTDTGGSTRQPASYTGTVGVRPTYGRVSRLGAAAMGSSFDQIAPITRNVADAKIILDIIAGQDGKDMTALPKNNFLQQETNFKKKIGVPRKFLEGLRPEVLEFFNKSLERFKKAGYEIIDIELDILKYTLPVYYTIIPAEMSTNMARYDGLRYGSFIKGENMVDSYSETRGALLGEEVKKRIILGTYILSAGYSDQYYNKAVYLREELKKEFKKRIADLDAIVMPTAPTPAFKLGENSTPMDMYLADIFTVVSSLIGNPSISVPAGNIDWEGEKLPFGMQILTAHEDEKTMFQVATDFEKNV